MIIFWLSHIFLRYLTNRTIFGQKVTERGMCVLIFSTSFVRNISSHSKKKPARCHHKHKHPSSPMRTDLTDGQTYMTEKTVAFRKFANALNKTTDTVHFYNRQTKLGNSLSDTHRKLAGGICPRTNTSL